MVLAIDRNAIRRTIRKDDVPFTIGQTEIQTKKEIADQAFRAVERSFRDLTLLPIQIRGKLAYRVDVLPDRIALRCLNNTIKYCIKPRAADRDLIVRQLITVLREGVHHRVYKFDIKAFFESINTDALFREISTDGQVPRSAVALLRGYFERLKVQNIDGIPRGIPLSATLAEFAMQGFDSQVSRLPNVYFYARYVDDIVIVTSDRDLQSNFGRKVRRLLPYSLTFNTAKTAYIDLPIHLKSTGIPLVGNFDYLGYNLAIHETCRTNRRLIREIEVTIAPKKIRRIKTRLCCAVAKFIDNEALDSLHKRIKILTGNYNVRDIATGRTRNVGLYCNYRRANNLTPLLELDSFYRSLVVGTKSRLAKKVTQATTIHQRRALLVHSFASSFQKKTFYNFPVSELTNLTRCWRNA